MRKLGWICLSLAGICLAVLMAHWRSRSTIKTDSARHQEASSPAAVSGAASMPPNLTQPRSSEPVDSVSSVLNDAKQAARERYVNKMQAEFRNEGVEATISDLDGAMVVVSDALKLKPDRDRLMRSAFNPAYRRALCTAGFKTVEFRSGAIFGDGDTHSLGCPGTKEERESRLEAQRSQRQAFVDKLQASLNSGAESEGDIQVEQGADVLILTGASAKDVPPKMFRSMFEAEFGDGSDNKLCSVGFRALAEMRFAGLGNGDAIF